MQDFEYIYNNYNKIIDELVSKDTLKPRQEQLLKDALLMDKLRGEYEISD